MPYWRGGVGGVVVRNSWVVTETSEKKKWRYIRKKLMTCCVNMAFL